MSSNFDLGLTRQNPAPWLNQQISPLDYSAGGQNSDPAANANSVAAAPAASAVPNAAAAPQASAANPYPTPTPKSKADIFWQQMTSLMGARHPVLGAISAALAGKANATDINNQQAVAGWKSQEQLRMDQAKMDLEKANMDRQERIANAYGVHNATPYTDWRTKHPDADPLEYIQGVQDAKPGPQPKNSTPYQDWHDQHPGGNPLDYEAAVASGRVQPKQPHWTKGPVQEGADGSQYQETYDDSSDTSRWRNLTTGQSVSKPPKLKGNVGGRGASAQEPEDTLSDKAALGALEIGLRSGDPKAAKDAQATFDAYTAGKKTRRMTNTSGESMSGNMGDAKLADRGATAPAPTAAAATSPTTKYPTQQAFAAAFQAAQGRAPSATEVARARGRYF